MLKISLTTLLTIVLNIFTPVRIAGEDLLLGRLELDTIKSIFSDDFKGVHLFAPYYQSMPSTALLSLIGQLLLLMSLFIRKKKIFVLRLALIILWFAFLNMAMIPELFLIFLKGAPFIVSSVILFLLTTRKKLKS
jgi:hypothetical protein